MQRLTHPTTPLPGPALHFWATGSPVMLAQGLKAALDMTNSAKPAGSQ
jgi:hypothetical protein